MSEHRTILVCGLPRCGSSLTMQMLDLGGVPTTGRYPAYEPEQTGPSSFDAEWVRRQTGRAVKILDPELRPASFFDPDQFALVLLRRDASQQTASQIKFMYWQLGYSVEFDNSRKTRRRLAASNQRDTRTIELMFRSSGCPLLELRFEDLVGNPGQAAEALAEFVAPWFPLLQRARMASAVRPRSSDCLPFMLEEQLGDAEARA